MANLSLVTREKQQYLREVLAPFSKANAWAGPPSRYVVLRKWLMHEDVVASQPKLRHAILAEHGKLVTTEMPLSADSIAVGRHARILRFKNHPERCAKAILPDPAVFDPVTKVPKSLHREIRALKTVSDLHPVFKVARPIASDQAGQWLVDETIAGQPLRKSEVGEFLDEALLPFYRASSRLRPLARLAHVERLTAALEEIHPGFPLPKLDDVLPFALGHGDLAQSNILQSENGVNYLIDWELAGMMPVAFDLVPIFKNQRWLLPQVLGAIRGLGRGSEPIIPPETQLALGILAKTGMILRSDDSWQQYLMTAFGMKREEADTRKKAQIDDIREIIRDLHRMLSQP